jgi:hypothetical protein
MAAFNLESFNNVQEDDGFLQKAVRVSTRLSEDAIDQKNKLSNPLLYPTNCSSPFVLLNTNCQTMRVVTSFHCGRIEMSRGRWEVLHYVLVVAPD